MERKAHEVMELLEITHLSSRNTNELSSGEARRILIARALVHDPRALVLDEPTTSLDLRATWELREVLRKLAANGISILMVTHHLPDIIPEMGRVVLIRAGRVVMDGQKESVLEAGALSGLFGVPVEVLERGGYYHVL
jgi:iron complex transport system ATP-binding protein